MIKQKIALRFIDQYLYYIGKKIWHSGDRKHVFLIGIFGECGYIKNTQSIHEDAKLVNLFVLDFWHKEFYI
jgi:hypothetical protein